MFLRDSISNGNPREQALIRRWWHDQRGAQGTMVWEYYLHGKYADGVLLCDTGAVAVEEPGADAPRRFPLRGTKIILCEAKRDLTPELIGQALVYSRFASFAGAEVLETIVLSESGATPMQDVAKELGLAVVVRPLD